jgi:hypothetical protein
MRILFHFLSTMILSFAVVILLTYLKISEPWPSDAIGIDERSLAYVFSLAFNLILVLGSSTMFLNFIKNIRNNNLYSFASFFLAPILLMLYMMSKFEGSGISSYYAIIFLPFFCFLTLNFIFYRKFVNLKLKLLTIVKEEEM